MNRWGDQREVTGIQKQSSPVGEKSTAIITGEEFAKESMPEREVGKKDWDSVNLVALHWEIFSHYIAVGVVRRTE